MKPAANAAISTNPLAVLRPSRRPKRYTLQEYLQREERSVERHDYFDGTIVSIPMARGPHNIIVGNLITCLNNAILMAEKDMVVFGSNQKIYLPALNYGVYPDALVVSDTPVYWDDNQVLLTNPLLVVEVLSKSTRNYDRKEKFDEYQTLPSFKEYVLVDQDKAQVETRYREEHDLWRYTTYNELGQMVSLRSIGCSILVSDIYRKTGV